MPQATALGAKMCRGIFFIAEDVCEKAWRRLARVYRGKNSCVRPQNRLIREKKRDKSMAFGHWKQKNTP